MAIFLSLGHDIFLSTCFNVWSKRALLSSVAYMYWSVPVSLTLVPNVIIQNRRTFILISSKFQQTSIIIIVVINIILIINDKYILINLFLLFLIIVILFWISTLLSEFSYCIYVWFLSSWLLFLLLFFSLRTIHKTFLTCKINNFSIIVTASSRVTTENITIRM